MSDQLKNKAFGTLDNITVMYACPTEPATISPGQWRFICPESHTSSATTMTLASSSEEEEEAVEDLLDSLLYRTLLCLAGCDTAPEELEKIQELIPGGKLDIPTMIAVLRWALERE